MTRISLLLVPFALFAETGQTLPGGAGDLEFSGKDDGSPHLSGGSPQFKKVESEKTYSLPGGSTPLKFDEEKFDHYGQKLPTLSPGQMVIITKKDVLRKIRSRGETSLGLQYIYDTFSYSDAANIFEETFQSDASGSHQFGILQFSAMRFFNRKLVDFYWKVNLGIGYNRGPGFFAGTGQKSKTHFQLWTIPLDLMIGADLPIGWSSVMVGAAVGPSVMGLIQSRDDYGTNEKGRRKRQYSFGFAYQVRASIDISHFFADTAYTLYQSYGISRCYFNLMARGHSYSGFQQSDISIGGISFGAGFTFELL